MIKRPQANTWARSLILAAAAANLALLGCAQKPPSDAEEPASTADAEARGEEITSRMLKAYRDAKSYADHATYMQQSAYKGEGIERELPFFEMSLAFERPNRIRLTLKESLASLKQSLASVAKKAYDIASDGRRMRCAAAELDGQIQESAAPLELTTQNLMPDPLLREVFENRSLGDVFPQLAMLLDKDDSTQVFPQDENPRLLGRRALRDRECYRVASTSPFGERVLWIDCATYALRRMELPIEKQRAALDPNNQFSHLAVWIDFEDGTFDAEISPEAFEMEIPVDGRRVRRFVAPPPPAPPEEFGKPLADFAFESLDGAKVTSTDLHGKTTLLDFWQIDCAPCRAHTPRLEQVYQDLKRDDKFAMYAVNIEGPAAPDDSVTKTLKSWGGTMPLLRDRNRSSMELAVQGTPTLMLVDAQGRLQYKHLGELRDVDPLMDTIKKVSQGVDVVAQGRAEHAQLVADFNRELEAETIKDSLVEVEIKRAEVASRELPKSWTVTELWKSDSASVSTPGNILALGTNNNGQASSILVADGGQAIVEFAADGERLARHELSENAEQAGGFLRMAVDADGHRYIAASGVGWQKVQVFDEAWKPVLSFPKDRHPGIADVQLADLAGNGELRLYAGYWGGVGIQGVGLDGKRKWAERSLDQVVELAIAPSTSEGAPSKTSQLWATSNRGTVLELNDKGERQRQLVVGDLEIMHLAVADLDSDGQSECCGLAVEEVGNYRVVGFTPDGEVLWQHDLPKGEYVHQVERIQAVMLPGDKAAWMVAAPGGSIQWLSADGLTIDQFRYGEEVAGVALANGPDGAILLVSSPKVLTAWKLQPAADETAPAK